MFRIQAPIPGPHVTTVLPSPLLGDQKSTIGDVKITKSMNGTIYTSKKSKGGRTRLQWSFKISIEKAKELREFFKIYYSTLVQIIDHLDNTWVGYFTTNPFTFTDGSRTWGPVNEEYTNITLTFEEKS